MSKMKRLLREWFPAEASPQSAYAFLGQAGFPVEDSFIFICEKCGKKLASSDSENPSRRLQLELKQKISAAGRKGKIKAVLTSCMDLCPEGKIAVGVAAGNRESQFFTLGLTPGDSVESAADVVLEKTSNMRPT